MPRFSRQWLFQCASTLKNPRFLLPRLWSGGRVKEETDDTTRTE